MPLDGVLIEKVILAEFKTLNATIHTLKKTKPHKP